MRWSEAEYARYIQNTEQNTSSPKPKNKYSSQKRGLMVYVLIEKGSGLLLSIKATYKSRRDKRLLPSGKICCDRGCREYRTWY